MDLFVKLRYILTKKERRKLWMMFFISIFISLMETVGVSIIMPFITVATNFSIIHQNVYFSKLYHFFHFEREYIFVISFGIFLVFFYLARGMWNLFYFYALARFARGRYHTIACKLFENYLGMPYRTFIDKNSSDLVKALTYEAQNLSEMLYAILFMFSEIFIIIFIYVILLFINWKVTLIITLFLAVNGVLLVKIIARIIKKAGVKREESQKIFFELINTSFGNFKMIKLRSNNDQLTEEFSLASSSFVHSIVTHHVVSHIPRLFLEAVGFVIVVFIVVYLLFKHQTNISHAIGIISIFILGLYRLMPSANRILTCYSEILFRGQSLEIIYDYWKITPEKLTGQKIDFHREIRLEQVSFRYLPQKQILEKIDLVIKKGEKIAFVGKSGSGKSTLVDLLIGLYRPRDGQIWIDDQLLTEGNMGDWRKKIGYIPQHVYLFDGSVRQNVAFGSKVDERRVREVLAQANILDFLEKHQEGIDTVVGEGGIKLSGGQKQRIAIARALYHSPDILVLDEATSALDDETEARIMEEIYRIGQEKTLIIIAHRLTTIKKCQKVYEVRDYNIVENKNEI